MIGENQGDATGRNHREPIATDPERRAETTILGQQLVGTIRVDRNVLRCRERGQRDREQGDRKQGRLRRQSCDQDQRDDDAALHRNIQPRRRPKPWQRVTIEQRRPEEFEYIGEADKLEHTDRFQTQATDRTPGFERRCRQRQRQTGTEAEQADRGAYVRAAAPESGAADSRRCAHFLRTLPVLSSAVVDRIRRMIGKPRRRRDRSRSFSFARSDGRDDLIVDAPADVVGARGAAVRPPGVFDRVGLAARGSCRPSRAALNSRSSQARSSGRQPEFFWFDVQFLMSLRVCTMFQSPQIT